MENYLLTATKTFKNTLTDVMKTKKVSKAEAFRFINKFDTLQEVKRQLFSVLIIEMNKLIKIKGINEIYENSKRYSQKNKDLKKVILIRYMLKDIENKRGYLSSKIITEIANKAIDNKIYKSNQKITIEHIEKDIKELVNILYKFDPQKHILGLKYQN